MRQIAGLAGALSYISNLQTATGNAADTAAVADVIDRVRTGGDAALSSLGGQFDRHPARELRVSRAELESAHRQLDPELLEAIRLSIARVRNYYGHQKQADFSFEDHDGTLSLLSVPLDSVGCYIPGGQAPLFSSVIMLAVPAQVAGVKRIVLASPPAAGGLPHAAVLAAAHELGLEEVYCMGGAQAVAALAYGTETVRPVSKIVGPGNRFVVEAKRQVFGAAGIESLPGPTETLVLADGSADIEHVIADLLAQAEHDGAVPVLVTDSPRLLQDVTEGIAGAAASLPTAGTALESLRERGLAILVDDLEEGLEVANAFAPEHLCLLVQDPAALLPRVRNAGGVFLGAWSMEALGDYVAGPSHVMPTGRSARFSSFVNVRDFEKVIPVLHAGPELVQATGPAAVLMARAEGLEAHARAIEARLES